MYCFKITGVAWFECNKAKTLQLIEFSDPLLNHPTSTGLLGSYVNTTASIYVLFHWQEKTFVDV